MAEIQYEVVTEVDAEELCAFYVQQNHEPLASAEPECASTHASDVRANQTASRRSG